MSQEEGQAISVMASDKEELASVEAPRENMIATAINFLQNPKVRESPFAQRRTFLEKKGLTTQEIDIAIQRSGTAQDEHQQVALSPPAVYPQAGSLPPVQSPVSTWSRIRDMMASAIVIGGVSYAIYMFYKRYIKPIWFGPSPEEKQLVAIQKSVEELRTNIAETLGSIKELQHIVNKQQENIDDVVKSSAAQRGSSELHKMQDSQHTNEIKEEIKSLKGLLLNRKQFPATPKTTPVIPSWQLEANKSSSPAVLTPQSQDSSPANSTEETATGPAEPPQTLCSSSQPAPGSDLSLSEQNQVKEDTEVTVNGHLEESEDSVSPALTQSADPV